MNQQPTFDYIIVGAGCAGLSLAMQMCNSPFFADKNILLIDKERKNKQDRTWSFWDKEGSIFDAILTKSWNHLIYKHNSFYTKQNIAPYQYKMIRSENFYSFCLQKIEQHKNIVALQGDVSEIVSNKKESYIMVDNKKIIGHTIFSSVLLQAPSAKETDIYLLQHFMGWIVEMQEPVFDVDTATLMDFSVLQNPDAKLGAAFVYSMPTSTTKALIEYTVFSEETLPEEYYKIELEKYIAENFPNKKYTITEQEYGVIPMTTVVFPAKQNNIHFIGTAGGATKISSGYTFQFIQQQVQQIVKQIINNKPIDTALPNRRFAFYDHVLLKVITAGKLSCAEVFTRLFQKNKMPVLLDFLHNKTSIFNELAIFITVQQKHFVKAVIGILRQK